MTVSGWLRPSYYYVYGEKVHRNYARAILVCLVGLAILSTGLGAALQRSRQRSVTTVPNSSSEVALVAAPNDESLESNIQPGDTYKLLQKDIDRWIAKQGNNSHWSIIVQDLDNSMNHTLSNPADVYDKASDYKLFLSVALSQRLPFAEWTSTQLTTNNKQQSMIDCIRAVIVTSDKSCSDALGKYLNLETATQTLKSQGFEDTTITYKDTTTTVRDTMHYFVGLYRGQWFSKQERDFILASMSQQKYEQGIAAGCKDCTVLNKTSQLSGSAYDGAIVTDGSSHYAVVVFSRGGSLDQVADLGKIIHERVSRP